MDLERFTLGCRGLRISCCIVGIPVIPRSLVVYGRMSAAHAVHSSVPNASALHQHHTGSLVLGTDAVGFPEVRGTARILTTAILKPKPEKHPMPRRVVRIGGVGTLVNSLKSCGFTPADRSEESRGRAV